MSAFLRKLGLPSLKLAVTEQREAFRQVSTCLVALTNKMKSSAGRFKLSKGEGRDGDQVAGLLLASRTGRHAYRRPGDGAEPCDAALVERLRESAALAFAPYPDGETPDGWEVVHSSGARIMRPAFVVSRRGDEVNLAVRGTEDVSDILTDLTLAAEGFGNGFVHRGVLRSARNVMKEAAPVLRDASFSKLTVAGHSLGGSVAAVVSVMLRADEGIDAAHCDAFGPMPAVCSNLADEFAPTVTSVVLGCDPVPRATEHNIVALVYLLNNVKIDADTRKRVESALHGAWKRTLGSAEKVLRAATASSDLSPSERVDRAVASAREIRDELRQSIDELLGDEALEQAAAAAATAAAEASSAAVSGGGGEGGEGGGPSLIPPGRFVWVQPQDEEGGPRAVHVGADYLDAFKLDDQMFAHHRIANYAAALERAAGRE